MDLDRLDELSIPAPQTGAALQRLGVTAQFHLADGQRPEAREAALDVILDAFDLAPEAFTQWMGTDDHRPRRIRPTFRADARASLTPLISQPDQLMSLALWQRQVPPRWQAELTMTALDTRRPRLSPVTVSVPPSAALTEVESYVDRVRAWASQLRPEHGTAGFALVAEIGMAHQSRGAAWGWWDRYPGLDVAPFNLQPKPGRYQSVNWLTLLGEPVAATLGGIDAIRQRLRDAAAERDVTTPSLTPYDGGVLIRAADRPLLGDRTRGVIPAEYRAVNAALVPARFEAYPDGPNMHLLDAPRSRDLRQATLEWVRRFDD